MPHDFDANPLGAVLEFAALQARHPGADRAEDKLRWNKQNVRSDNIDLVNPWGGPPGTLTKSHLSNVLGLGRLAGKVRQNLDWAFRLLESHQLLVPFAGDANLNTTYRVVSDRGRELFENDSYEEFLFGLPRVVERWRSSVFCIANADGPGIGTAFVVGPATLVTARHVVEDMPKFVVQSSHGETLEHDTVQFHPDANVDLALVQLRASAPARPFRLAREWDLLDEVVVFGYPPIPQATDAYLVVNRGEISSKPQLFGGKQEVIVVSCMLRGGNSGGPVVDRFGAVVGVVSRQLFKQVAPTEATINESLGMAAATTAASVRELVATTG